MGVGRNPFPGSTPLKWHATAYRIDCLWMSHVDQCTNGSSHPDQRDREVGSWGCFQNQPVSKLPSECGPGPTSHSPILPFSHASPKSYFFRPFALCKGFGLQRQNPTVVSCNLSQTSSLSFVITELSFGPGERG